MSTSKTVFKAFDTINNKENKVSEFQALQLLSQLPSDQVATIKDDKKWTLLHHACYSGWYAAVKVLLDEYFCDVSAKNDAGSGPLRLACWGGNLELVKYLVFEKNCKPDQTNDLGLTPLHNASLGGHLDIVKFLVLELKCDPASCRDDNGWTPLHSACQNGHLDLAKFLIFEHNCDPTCSDNDGWTPLHVTCHNGHLHLAEFLILEQKCNPSCTDNDGWTPLHLTCQNGHLVLAKFLILEQKCGPSCRDNDGWTPLHLACQNGHLALVKFLILEQKCDPSCRDNDCQTPLHLACQKGHIDVIRFLLFEQKCDPSCRDNDGLSPLHLVCTNGCIEVLKLFLLKECDLSCKDNNGQTPLHSACKTGHLDSVKFLVQEQKCDPSCKDKDGMTPLHFACQNQHTDIIRFLLFEQKCDPSCRSNDGKSSMHLVCINGYIDVLKLLLLKECDLSCKDNDGQTPLHSACRTGHLDIAKLLVLDQKCDPSCKDKNGLTPLHLACEYGHLQVAKFLLDNQKSILTCTTKSGDTPLHLACYNRHLEVAMFLILDQNFNPSCTNKSGQTPLHLASKMGYLNIAVFLVLNQKCDPLREDKDDWSPLRIAFQNGFTDLVRLFLTASQVNNTRAYLPPEHYNMLKKLNKDQSQFKHFPSLKVFIVGDQGAGKSTLAKAINLKFSGKKGLISKKVWGVRSPTAGIDPIHFQDTKTGNIILYDFAGQREYYSSHSATFKSVSSSEGSVVLVVTDLSKSEEEITKTLLYWILFIRNEFQEKEPSVLSLSEEHKVDQENQIEMSHNVEQNSTTLPLYIVGSHADKLKHQGINPTSKLHSVLGKLPVVPKHFTKESSVVLNCTKLSSRGLGSMCDIISKHSNRFQEQLKLKMDVQLHFLSSLIKQSFFNKVACQLKDISILINADENFAFRRNGLLPTDIKIVSRLLETLSQNGEFIYLQNTSNHGNSWVIIDKAVLLTEINGTIFAPKDFEQHQTVANSTGVVPMANVQKVFPKYDATMIMEFLLHLEFCRRIQKAEILKSTYQIGTQGSTDDDCYYFFPALIKNDRPVNVHSLIEDTNEEYEQVYSIGWCLQCINEEDFFTSHFWHILLLRLSFQFAPPPDHGLDNKDIPVVQRECNIWRTGIQWYLDGVQTIVEFIEQNKAVTILVGCSKGKEMKCVRHRSELIKSILQIKEEILPTVRVQDYILHPEELEEIEKGIKSLHTFSLNKLATAILEQNDLVASQKGAYLKPAEIDKLLYFEPYRCVCFIQKDSELFNYECRELTLGVEFLQRVENATISELYADHFKEMLIYEFTHASSGRAVAAIRQACESSSSPSHQCSQMLLCWKKYTLKPTYGALKSLLDKYSIFCDKDPMALAGRERILNAVSRMNTEQGNKASNIPEQSAAFKLLLPMAGDWQNLAVLLGIPDGRIKVIRQENLAVANDCLRETLAEWLQHYDPNPSWNALVEAVEALGNQALAQTIKDHYMQN